MVDIVIFYDFDWNLIIDLQVMDCVYCFGQMKQVIVYCFIMCGIIEECICKCVMQKEEVQCVVIMGGLLVGGVGVDFFGCRVFENWNCDIVMWFVDDEQVEMIECCEKELFESGEYDKIQKKCGGKWKWVDVLISLDEMYYEGEFMFFFVVFIGL